MRNKEKLEGYKHYCPLCGKEFWAFADWKYRRRVKGIKNKVYYCSYKCIRKVEKDEKEEVEKAAGQTGNSAVLP